MVEVGRIEKLRALTRGLHMFGVWGCWRPTVRTVCCELFEQIGGVAGVLSSHSIEPEGMFSKHVVVDIFCQAGPAVAWAPALPRTGHNVVRGQG